MSPRIAWGIAGAGHFLPEIAHLLRGYSSIDLFLSRAADEVIRQYRLNAVLHREGQRVIYDRVASAPEVNKLYLGIYRVVVIAPATSNSIAKFVCGISDSLLSNLFAHAGKTRTPVVVLPTDVAPIVDSRAPGGMVRVYPRAVDLENVRRLTTFEGVTVVENPEELKQCLATFL